MNRCPKCGMGYGQHATYCTDCGDNLVRETALPSADFVRVQRMGRPHTRMSEYVAAVQRYYDSGTNQDHEAVLLAWERLIEAQREELRPTVRVSDGAPKDL